HREPGGDLLNLQRLAGQGSVGHLLPHLVQTTVHGTLGTHRQDTPGSRLTCPAGKAANTCCKLAGTKEGAPDLRDAGEDVVAPASLEHVLALEWVVPEHEVREPASGAPCETLRDRPGLLREGVEAALLDLLVCLLRLLTSRLDAIALCLASGNLGLIDRDRPPGGRDHVYATGQVSCRGGLSGGTFRGSSGQR